MVAAEVISILIVITAVAMASDLSKPATPEQFVERWAERMLRLEDPADTQGLPSSEWTEGIFVRRFESGEWVAARATDDEYSHASRETRFDATVFVDSSQTVHVSTAVHICGHDALAEYLGEESVEATSLAQFYEALRDWNGLDWHLSEWRPL